MSFVSIFVKEKYIIILSLLLPLSLVSCGFQAVHDVQTLSDRCIFDLELKQPESIEETEFYNQLLTLLPRCKDKQNSFYLEYDIELDKDYNIVKSNSDILNRTVTMKVNYKLLDKATNKRELEGKFSRFASYIVNSSPYHNYSVNKKLTNSLAVTSAREMNNILLHFNLKFKK